MKILWVCLTGLALFLSIACCRTNQTIYSNTGVREKEENASADTLWRLKNRVPDCDSALAFMKQTIVPLKSYSMTDRLMPKERESVVSFPGVAESDYKNEKYRYYISTECLVGQPVKVAVGIFCLPETVDSFLTLDKKFQEATQFGKVIVSH